MLDTVHHGRGQLRQKRINALRRAPGHPGRPLPEHHVRHADQHKSRDHRQSRITRSPTPSITSSPAASRSSAGTVITTRAGTISSPTRSRTACSSCSIRSRCPIKAAARKRSTSAHTFRGRDRRSGEPGSQHPRRSKALADIRYRDRRTDRPRQLDRPDIGACADAGPDSLSRPASRLRRSASGPSRGAV